MWGAVLEVSPVHPQELWSQDWVYFSLPAVVCIAHQALQQQSSHISWQCSETLDKKQYVNERDVN